MHLIDDRFTRLQPGTVFLGLDIALALEPTTFLAPVPEQWRNVHDPLLVANWQALLLQSLRHPVQVESHPSGHRHVMVLGTAIFDISPRGTVRCYAWRYDDNGLIQLQPFPDDEVVAVGSPFAGLWMRVYALGAFERLRRAHPPHLHDACRAYVNWLMEEMLAEHWQPDAAAAVRKQVADALQLDPSLLRLAATLCRSHEPQLVRLSEYNHCVLHRARVERLEREAPQLALLHSLLHQDLDPALEPTQAMAEFLEQRGIGRGMWRLLVQQGSEWMRPLLAFYRIPYGARPAVVADLLSVTQMFGTQELVPHDMLCAMMAIGGNPNRQRNSPTYAQECAQIEDLMARVGQLYFSGGQTERLALLDMCDAIFNWGFDHWAARPARSRRTIRLTGLLREVKAYQRRQALAHSNRTSWATPWRLVCSDPLFEIHILGSALCIWNEAQTMRHCADMYIERCARGEYLMVSIRPAAASGARRLERSTVGFARISDGFVVDNMSGFANARVDPQMVAIARDCVLQLNLQLIRDVSQRCLEDAIKEMDVADAMNDSAEDQRAVELQVRAA